MDPMNPLNPVKQHTPADCDLVLDMEEAGVGVEEILQYARGVLSDDEIAALVDGLQRIAASSSASPAAGAADVLEEEKDVEPCLELRDILQQAVLR